MREALLFRAQALAAKLSWLGIGPDLPCMPLIDLWAACRWLERLFREAHHGPTT